MPSANLPYTVHSPVPSKEPFTLRRVVGREGTSTLFEYVVDLLLPDPALDFDTVVGHEMSFSLAHDAVHLGKLQKAPPSKSSSLRHFHGYVTDFTFVEGEGGFSESQTEYFLYRAVVRPHLWRLTQRTNSRIFQKLGYLDIVEALLKEHGIADLEVNGSPVGKPREYTVQYQETDFAFFSRLLEHEGLHYFFRAKQDKHVLVLGDSSEGHEEVPGHGTLNYLRVSTRERHERIWSWRTSRHVLPGRHVSVDYDFEKPTAQLQGEATSAVERKHPKAKSPEYEIFEYPEPVVKQPGYSPKDLEAYSRARIEEVHSAYETIVAETDVRALACGALFKLSDGAPATAKGKSFIVTSCAFVGEQSPLRSIGSATEAAPTTAHPTYKATLTTISSEAPYRPARTTPKPRIFGPQTALVVGKQGEEIWTDKYGRVKVQFHWDREGEKNEDSSCWVRVSQAWAGQQFGSIHIPRMGQEVVVEFLDGDPDMPIVTGRVYNGFNMPPYDLPANQTQSGIKSRSSKGGAKENANEIRFEDKKGSEEFFVQAEKDHNTVVKNAQTLKVGATRDVKVDKAETILVGDTRTTTVKKKDTVTLEDEHEMTVTKKVTETFKDDHALAITGQQTVKIDKSKNEQIADTYDLKTDKKFILTQGQTTLTFAQNAVSLDAKSKVTVTRGPATVTIDDAGAIKMATPVGITFEVGPSTVKISPVGVEVNGMKIALTAVATSLELTPAMGKLTGPLVNVMAQALCAVKGAILKLG